MTSKDEMLLKTYYVNKVTTCMEVNLINRITDIDVTKQDKLCNNLRNLVKAPLV